MINVYKEDGNSTGSIELPKVFGTPFRSDLVLRAILSEQSRLYQRQGRSLLAGMQTTAVYVGKYSGYRHGRHMGIAIRPRQKLGGGAMGDVRKIPSSVKGRRAHPQKTEKSIEEHINKAEYLAAIRSAIGGCSDAEMLKKRHTVAKDSFPIVVENSIEGIEKTKQLMKVLAALGVISDIERSHKPRLAHNSRRSSKRHFRKSLLIIASNVEKLERAGRNIPGVDVLSVKELSAEALAPGGRPRLSLWSMNAIEGIEKALTEYR